MTELTKGDETRSGIYMDVAISKIVVGDRFRKKYGDIDDLAISIQDKGLLHPLILDDSLNLIAGGRRLAAMKQLGWNRTAAIIRKAKSKIDSLEVELLENVMRLDMEWQERTALVKKINSLYETKETNWTQEDTAELLNRSTGSISSSLKLADAMEHIPELAEAKTEEDAHKKLSQLQEALIVNELEKRRKARVESNTVDDKLEALLKTYEESYIVSDIFDGLSLLEDNDTYIRFMEVDPPYGIDLINKKRTVGKNEQIETYKEIPQDIYEEFLNKLTKELFRVSSDEAHIVFWFGIQWYKEVYSALTQNGWVIDPIPAIWTKTHGQTNDPQNKLARAFEPFFYGKKKSAEYGIFRSTSQGRLNLFSFDRVFGGDKYHPTQRSIDLMKELVSLFGDFLPKDKTKVLVPFAGSGATIIAARELGYQSFGYDINDEYKSKYLVEIRRRYEERFAIK